MALIYRDGRPYLYKSIRKGGRVTSEYRASGESAVLINTMEAIEREEREYERWREQQEREEDRDRQRELDEWVADVRALAHAALETAGFHRHKGQWRRRRDNRSR